jgi:hypothetical protein
MPLASYSHAQALDLASSAFIYPGRKTPKRAVKRPCKQSIERRFDMENAKAA